MYHKDAPCILSYVDRFGREYNIACDNSREAQRRASDAKARGYANIRIYAQRENVATRRFGYAA